MSGPNTEDHRPLVVNEDELPDAAPRLAEAAQQRRRYVREPNRAGSTSKPCPTCGLFMNPGGYCSDQWHRPVTAQPSLDLPDSLRRDRKRQPMQSRFPREVGRDTVDLTAEPVPDDNEPDLYREAAQAYRSADGATYVTDAPWPALRAAVDRVAELVRAEQATERVSIIEAGETMLIECRQQRDQARADLAAMTARAESAEHRYDVMRREAEHLGHNLLAAVYHWLEAAPDRLGLKDGRRIIDALCDDFMGRTLEGWLPAPRTLPASTDGVPPPSGVGTKSLETVAQATKGQ